MKWKFIYDAEKNKKLKAERGISFEEVITIIEAGQNLDVRPHHNQKKYANQHIYMVEVNNYVYLVPCIRSDETILLKTIYPCRKATARHLKHNKRKEEE